MKLAQTIESLMIDQALNKVGFVWKLLSPHQMQVLNFQNLQLKALVCRGLQGIIRHCIHDIREPLVW